MHRRGQGDHRAEAATPRLSVSSHSKRRPVEAHHPTQRVTDHTQTRVGRQRLAVKVQTASHRFGDVDQWSAGIGHGVHARPPCAVDHRPGESTFEHVTPRVVAATFGQEVHQAAERPLGVARASTDTAQQDDLGLSGRPDEVTWPPARHRFQRLFDRHADEGIVLNSLSLWERPRAARVRGAYEISTFAKIRTPHPSPLPEGEGVIAPPVGPLRLRLAVPLYLSGSTRLYLDWAHNVSLEFSQTVYRLSGCQRPRAAARDERFRDERCFARTRRSGRYQPDLRRASHAGPDQRRPRREWPGAAGAGQ